MTQGAGRRTRSAGTFGSVDQRASGRFRARYIGPDGQRHQAPVMFPTRGEARAWLSLRQSEIIRRIWEPEATPRTTVTFEAYAEGWLARRELKARTHEHYRWLLDEHLYPAFGSRPLTALTTDDVRAWHATDPHRPPHAAKPRLRAAAHHPGDRGVRREDQRQPVRHPRGREHQAGQEDPHRLVGGAREDHRRDARAIPGPHPAGVLVCAALR